MIVLSNHKSAVRLFALEKSWIVGEAVRQLDKTAQREGMICAIGMPDLHPGKGSPVGAAFASRGIFYPALIGNDVGCGIGFWQTGLKANKIKRDKWAKKLSGLQQPWDGDIQGWLAERGLTSTSFDPAHGTIGGGNHFAELQVVDNIIDLEAFEALGLDKRSLGLLVHSGSRGIGDRLLRQYAEKHGADGIDDNTEAAWDYLEQHKAALKWAASNRALIAHRFASQLGGTCTPVLDLCHNSISQVEMGSAEGWLHRKGVVPADRGPLMVPGSRGALTYLVQPVDGEAQELNLWSLAHGAGRKWNRRSSRERIKSKGKINSLTRTSLGGRVICENRDLLMEEAPQAYKSVDSVVQDMQDEGLVRIIALFRPLITYKMRKR